MVKSIIVWLKLVVNTRTHDDCSLYIQSGIAWISISLVIISVMTKIMHFFTFFLQHITKECRLLCAVRKIEIYLHGTSNVHSKCPMYVSYNVIYRKYFQQSYSLGMRAWSWEGILHSQDATSIMQDQILNLHLHYGETNDSKGQINDICTCFEIKRRQIIGHRYTGESPVYLCCSRRG